MRIFANLVLLGCVMGCTLGAVSQQSGRQPEASIRGWLSDEQCAHGRAESGMYSGTNPRCAKQCVAKGKRVVLIDPERKMIFTIVNQALAKKNVGDYVEIAGERDLPAKTVKIISLKMVTKGAASCERPKLGE